jgi:hypothetical protein
MGRKITKLPTVSKVWLRLVAIFSCGFLVLYASVQIWLFTWKTYKNDEFGFSFRYPSSWFITKTFSITKDQLNKYGWVELYVDSVENLPNRTNSGPITSPGDVSLTIESNGLAGTIMDTRKEQGYFYKYVKVKLGNEVGYTYDGVGQTTKDSGNLCMYSKELFVRTENYTLRAYTLTYSENKSFFSKIKARFYNWIGSHIINSFIFIQ